MISWVQRKGKPPEQHPAAAPRFSLLSSSPCLVPSARLAVSDGFHLCSTGGQALDLFHVKEQLKQLQLQLAAPAWKGGRVPQ